MRASAFGELEVAKVLVGAGASLEAKDSFGSTALDDARNGNEPEVAAFLEAAAKVRACVGARCALSRSFAP